MRRRTAERGGCKVVEVAKVGEVKHLGSTVQSNGKCG